MEHAAERVDIHARVRRPASSLLRRHVCRRAHNHVAGSNDFVLARAGQAEIQNLYAGFPRHNIAGLKVAVNNTLAMSLDQGRRDLVGIEQRQLDGQRAAF